jgi:branched-chain amino acid transport system ATP-binding protein
MAVDHVDVTIHSGQVLGLIGPNGSGKTTFFNLITGIYRPMEGEIVYKGGPMTGKSPVEMARKGVSRTFQNSRLFLELSIAENVLSGMCYRKNSGVFDALLRPGRTGRQLREGIDRAVELLTLFSRELGVDPFKRAGDLPLPDRRRVEICRALASEPSLLLLDEPSAGMDPSETTVLMDEIRRVREYQPEIGIIVIEHDMTVIRGIAERVVVFNYGKKIAEGTFQAIAGLAEVRQAYLGERASS